MISMDKYSVAIERYKQGETIKEICSDLRIGNETLSRKLKLAGVQLRSYRKEEKFTENQINQILKLRKEKKSIRSIGEILGINRHKISLFLASNEEETRNLLNHKYHESIFEKIDTEEKAYWLGMLFADGHVSSHKWITGLTLQLSDVDHLEKFAKFIGGKVVNHSQNAKRVSVSNKKIFDSLVEKGCVERKSLILKFPDFNIVPIDLVRHFVRGYFDGDGHISIEKGRNSDIGSINFVLTGTLDFLNKLDFLLNLGTVLRPESKLGNVYDIRIRGNEKPLRILDWIYENSTIHLERKYQVYTKFKKEKQLMPSSGESR